MVGFWFFLYYCFFHFLVFFFCMACVVPENIPTPPTHPPGFSIPGGLWWPPSPPGISRIFKRGPPNFAYHPLEVVLVLIISAKLLASSPSHLQIMSVMFLCKLISLNIWVTKFKRQLFYVFVLTLTHMLWGELKFHPLKQLCKQQQKNPRNLQGSLVAVYFSSHFDSFFRFSIIEGLKTSLTYANALDFMKIVTIAEVISLTR